MFNKIQYSPTWNYSTFIYHHSHWQSIPSIPRHNQLSFLPAPKKKVLDSSHKPRAKHLSAVSSEQGASLIVGLQYCGLQKVGLGKYKIKYSRLDVTNIYLITLMNIDLLTLTSRNEIAWRSCMGCTQACEAHNIWQALFSKTKILPSNCLRVCFI